MSRQHDGAAGQNTEGRNKDGIASRTLRLTPSSRRHARVAALSLAMMLGSALAASAADCIEAAEPGIDWSACNRRNLSIQGANLEGANIQGADLGMTDLRNGTLTSANLEKAKLVRASLAGAVADSANFKRVEGYRTSFVGISAKGAGFQSAELQRADFADAVLAGANFEKAELGRASFKGADLADNHFAFANLARAGFSGAEVKGPLNFNGAYMFLTRIEGVDLSAATGLVQAQLDIACGDTATKLPAGLKLPASWPCGPSD